MYVVAFLLSFSSVIALRSRDHCDYYCRCEDKSNSSSSISRLLPPYLLWLHSSFCFGFALNPNVIFKCGAQSTSYPKVNRHFIPRTGFIFNLLIVQIVEPWPTLQTVLLTILEEQPTCLRRLSPVIRAITWQGRATAHVRRTNSGTIRTRSAQYMVNV